MCKIAALCFIIYVEGAIGFQKVDEDPLKRSNDYHYNIGELSAGVEFKNGLYIEAKHISGMNENELDRGLNAIMVGARIKLFGE